MTQHSKTPWTVEESMVRSECFIRDADGFSVAQMVRVKDARLIAAAPDLLAALKGLYSIAHAEGVVGDDTTLPAALAAIAKAEGRS